MYFKQFNFFALCAFLDYVSVCTQTGGHCQRVGWKSGQASGQMVCCYWMLLIGCVIPLYKDWCDFTVGHICMVTNMWKHDIYYSRTSFEKVWLMQTPLGVRMEGRMDAEEESLASSSRCYRESDEKEAGEGERERPGAGMQEWKHISIHTQHTRGEDFDSLILPCVALIRKEIPPCN